MGWMSKEKKRNRTSVTHLLLVRTLKEIGRRRRRRRTSQRRSWPTANQETLGRCGGAGARGGGGHELAVGQGAGGEGGGAGGSRPSCPRPGRQLKRASCGSLWRGQGKAGGSYVLLLLLSCLARRRRSRGGRVDDDWKAKRKIDRVS